MTINVYYSETTKSELKKIQNKYHVSISTIAQVICDIARTWQNAIMTNQLKLVYLDDNKKCKKTSIKPKNLKDILNQLFTKTELSKYISNTLYLIANNKYDVLLNTTVKEAINKYKNTLFNELAKKREVYYNYNAIIRNNIRVLKDNKEYIKRLIEQLENK